MWAINTPSYSNYSYSDYDTDRRVAQMTRGMPAGSYIVAEAIYDSDWINADDMSGLTVSVSVQNDPVNLVDRTQGVFYDSNGIPTGEVGLQPIIPTPNVRIGIDTPVGGVATTLPFNTGGVPSTVQTSPSWNIPLAPGVNVKFSGAVNLSTETIQGRATISTPISGLRGSIDNHGNTNLSIMGPQLNFPLGYGVNAYIGTSW